MYICSKYIHFTSGACVAHSPGSNGGKLGPTAVCGWYSGGLTSSQSGPTVPGQSEEESNPVSAEAGLKLMYKLEPMRWAKGGRTKRDTKCWSDSSGQAVSLEVVDVLGQEMGGFHASSPLYLHLAV